MGLDWQPLGRPKPGHEAEFNRLFDKLMDGVRAATRARERMRAIEVSPFETLGAPRIGFDEQADRWAEEQYRQRPAAEQSVYDELLVVRPPKRIVGGLTLKF